VLHSAIQSRDVEAIQQFMGDINRPLIDGLTPLMLALRPMRSHCTTHQRLEVLRALASKANFLVDEPCGGYTAVTWAACDHRLDVDILQWLIKDAGADVNAPDEWGSFAIHGAVESAIRTDITRKVLYLLSLEQLDLHLRDRAGHTALDVCRKARGASVSASTPLIEDALVRKVR
jgi:hypothetical protein